MLTIISSHAQIGSPRIFTTIDGLPSNEIYDIHEDRFGIIWLCTDNGVSRYDGYGFENFSPDNSELASTTVFKVFERNEKELWFTGFNRTVSMYHRDSAKFVSFPHNQTLIDSFVRWPQRIAFVGDTMYITGERCNNVARYIFSEDLLTFMPVEKFFDTKIGTNLGSYEGYQSHERILFSSTLAEGLFGGASNHIEPFGGQHPLRDYAKIGEVEYVAFRSRLFKGENGKWERVRTFPRNINGLSVSNSQELIVHSRSGIYFLKGDQWLHLFQERDVTDVVQDREGNFWLSTTDAGLIFQKANLLEEHHKSVLYSKRKLLRIEALDDYLVITDRRGKVHYLDTSLAIHQLTLDSSKGFEVYSTILSVKSLTRSYNELYLSGNWVIKQSDANSEEPLTAALMGKHMAAFYLAMLDPEHVIYCSSHSGYYVNHISNHPNYSKPPEFDFTHNFNSDVTNLRWYKDETYVCTFSGVYKIRPESYKTPTKLNYPDNDKRANDVIRAPDRTLYIATTTNGVLTVIGDSSYRFGKEQGLPSNNINCLKLDSRGYLWVGGPDGIIRLKPEGSRLSILNVFARSTGYPTGVVHDIEEWHNKMWFSTDQGLLSIDLDQIQTSNITPLVSLRQIKVNNERSRLESSLNYKQNDVEFHFVGVSQNKPAKDVYRYRLIMDGSSADTAWILSSQRSVRFSHLAPGHYTFEVAARNAQNQWSQPERRFIHIKPHFSQTKWFAFLVVSVIVLIVIGIVTAVYVTRARRARRASAIKELELNSLRNQMNPHFIFNSMNSLQNLIVENQMETSLDFISRFSSLMRRSLKFSRRDFIALEDEVEFIREYLETERLRFPDRFKYNVECELSLIDDQISIPPLLVQPLVENAVKHAFQEERADGKINVSFEERNNCIRIVVEDNGVGLNYRRRNVNGATHKSKGLKIVKERIAIMRDKYPDLHHDIQFADLSSDETGRTGTLIEIMLPILE